MHFYASTRDYNFEYNSKLQSFHESLIAFISFVITGASLNNSTDSSGINVYVGTGRSQSEEARTPQLNPHSVSTVSNPTITTQGNDDSTFVVEPSSNPAFSRTASEPLTVQVDSGESQPANQRAETRWANVTSGLMSMIRAQNRAVATSAARRRTDFRSEFCGLDMPMTYNGLL